MINDIPQLLKSDYSEIRARPNSSCTYLHLEQEEEKMKESIDDCSLYFPRNIKVNKETKEMQMDSGPIYMGL